MTKLLVCKSFCSLLLGLSSIGHALTRSEEAASLDRARQALAKGDCVDAILESAGIALSSSPNSHVANYYKAICQERLGDPASSYQSAMKILPNKLDEEKRKQLEELIGRLTYVPSSKPFSITASGGLINFTKDTTFTDGTFTDLVGSYASAANSLTLSGETAAIKQVNGSSYSQSHWIVLGEHRFMDSIGLKLGYRNQTSSAATVNGATNIISGLRWFNTQAQLGATYSTSAYEKNYPGKLHIAQTSFFGTYAFGDWNKTGLLSIDVKMHQINPKMDYNPKLYNSVAFKDAYGSWEAGLRYSISSISLATTFWSGEQVFAVHADGAVVYSNSTLHTGGQKFSVDYYYDGIWSIGALYGMEQLKDISTGIIGQSTVTSLSTSFYF